MNPPHTVPVVVDAHPQVRGRWSNIRWLPNASTGEVLNLGVYFEDSSGTRFVRTIEHFERLTCLYDKALASDAKFLSTVVSEALYAGRDIPVSGVFLSDAKFAGGASAQEIVATLFSATVPLGRPKRLPKEKPKKGLDTPDIRSLVFDQLRRVGGLNANRLIASESAMQVHDGGQTRYLDIPLQAPSSLGTVVSACLATPNLNELNLLRADADLQTARRLYSRDRLFMYVVRPHQENEAASIDQLFERYTWKFGTAGVAMKTYNDPLLVAGDILEDMLVGG